jgi:hypothetical protein
VPFGASKGEEFAQSAALDHLVSNDQSGLEGNTAKGIETISLPIGKKQKQKEKKTRRRPVV